MKHRSLVAVSVLIVTALIEFALPQVIKSARSQQLQQPSAAIESIARRLKDSQIVATYHWNVDEGKDLLCIVRRSKGGSVLSGDAVTLTIIDSSGKALYEDKFSEVERIYSVWALRKPQPQLAVEVGYGGSTSFLRLLDLKGDSVVSLTEKDGIDFDVSAEVRPQIRQDVADPLREPFEILVIHRTSTLYRGSVYRYEGGSYKYRGEFSPRTVGDFVEKQLDDDEAESAKRK
jgi:hypothetical protein